MNLLLCKYDNVENYELSNIINCYQDYFIFKPINNSIYLYLDIKVLKYYLTEGFNIKYRKHIFLFLKKTILSINNTSYKFTKQTNPINSLIDLNAYKNDTFLQDKDIENLEFIINISNKIRLNKNKFYIKDKNIIKLDNNFYANINLGRFFFSKIHNFLFKYNGIVLNYNSFKNKLLTLLSIYNINNIANNLCNINKFSNNKFNTKCSLILFNKKDIDLWYSFIEKYLYGKKIYSIISKKNLKKFKNSDIFELDFLFVDIKFLNSKYFNSYFEKYEIFESNNEFTNKLSDERIPIYNSIYDNMINKNIENEYVKNLYIFNWNNIVYDNIEDIKDIDKNNYMKYFTTYNTKYYLSENYLEESVYNYIIDTSIIFNNDKNNLCEIKNNTLNNKLPIDISNFYYFIKKELLIKNIYNKDYEYIYIDVELNNNERKIYNYLFNNSEFTNNLVNITDKQIKDIQLFLTDSTKYNFKIKNINEMEKINNEYYTNLINKELKKKLITELKDNNINNYKSKILYFQNTINSFNNKECYCTVCMDKINNNDVNDNNVNDNNITCIITCGHCFCRDCILKYITEKNINKDLINYECPVCRTLFNLDMLYSINNHNNEHNYKCSKLDKLFNIIGINEIDNNTNNNTNNNKIKKIIIVSQYIESVYSIKKYINNNNYKIILNHLFYNNISSKDKFLQLFNNFDYSELNQINYKYSIIVCNYDDIIKYNFKNINSIIFIDHPNENILLDIKEKYCNKYLNKIRFYNSSLEIYFLYVKDTIEEQIFEKYIKY